MLPYIPSYTLCILLVYEIAGAFRSQTDLLKSVFPVHHSDRLIRGEYGDSLEII